MSAVLLMANSGFAIGKMTCLHSGNVELSLGRAESCESSEIKSDQIQEPCCEILNFNLCPDSHVFSSIYKLQLTGYNLGVIDYFFSFFFNENSLDILSIFNLSFPIPPPKWPDIFSFISLFRI